MKRMNFVNTSLAVLTLAALALPASAQYNQGYLPNANYYSNQSPYYQPQSPFVIQGGYNSYWGWNSPNIFYGSNGAVTFPNTYDFFRPPANNTEAEDLAANAPVPVPGDSSRANALPRTSDAIQVEKDRNVIAFSWNGEPNAVNRITFALLDRGKQPIRQRIITRLPATARLTRNGHTAYYRVTVEYTNGTTNSVVAPL